MVRCAGTTARTIHGVKVSNFPWCLGESGVMSLSVNLGNQFVVTRSSRRDPSRGSAVLSATGRQFTTTRPGAPVRWRSH